MNSLRENMAWVEKTLTELVVSNPMNRLSDFNGQPIFDAPIIGVADGLDEIFETFKSVIDTRHLMPVEFLSRNSGMKQAGKVFVISWALPFTKEVRESNRGAEWPSRLYSLARNNGNALIHDMSIRFASLIKEKGHAAAAPCASEEYDAFRSPAHVFASSWSERHVAYAAGLGKFGLSGALITAAGSNVRFGSVVTDLPLGPISNSRDDYQAPCLASGGSVCGKCMDRCPAGAISSEGMDKTKCFAMRQSIRDRFMEEYTSSMQMVPSPVAKSGTKTLAYSLGCALCQCSVPCENAQPNYGE